MKMNEIYNERLYLLTCRLYSKVSQRRFELLLKIPSKAEKGYLNNSKIKK